MILPPMLALSDTQLAAVMTAAGNLPAESAACSFSALSGGSVCFLASPPPSLPMRSVWRCKG